MASETARLDEHRSQARYRNSRPRDHDNWGRFAPERSRPNTAPAYYLGHPASFWITAMRPRRRPSTPPASSGPPAISAHVRY